MCVLLNLMGLVMEKIGALGDYSRTEHIKTSYFISTLGAYGLDRYNNFAIYWPIRDVRIYDLIFYLLVDFFSGNFCFQLQMFWSIFWGFFLAFSKISIKSGISFQFPVKFLTCISFWALEMGSGLRKKMGWGSILIRLCFCLLCPALNIFWSRPLSKSDIYY